jgi:PAS domain-containing protein
LDAALRGEHFELEGSIPLESGETNYIINKYNPIESENGKVIGATVFIHDVTKEKKAEIKNRINELRYSSLFSGASDAIFYC